MKRALFNLIVCGFALAIFVFAVDVRLRDFGEPEAAPAVAQEATRPPAPANTGEGACSISNERSPVCTYTSDASVTVTWWYDGYGTGEWKLIEIKGLPEPEPAPVVTATAEPVEEIVVLDDGYDAFFAAVRKFFPEAPSYFMSIISCETGQTFSIYARNPKVGFFWYDGRYVAYEGGAQVDAGLWGPVPLSAYGQVAQMRLIYDESGTDNWPNCS